MQFWRTGGLKLQGYAVLSNTMEHIQWVEMRSHRRKTKVMVGGKIYT